MGESFKVVCKITNLFVHFDIEPIGHLVILKKS